MSAYTFTVGSVTASFRNELKSGITMRVDAGFLVPL